MSKKVYVDLSQQDVQDIINAYEKDIEKFNKQKEVLDKIKEIVNEMPYLWYADEEIERIDGTIELKYKEYDTSKLEKLLEEIDE